VSSEAIPAEKGVVGAASRHIERTAARLFASQGYDATSVREIVEAAGVTKPTLYYHFGSKEGLAHALLNVPLAALAESLQTIADGMGAPEAILEELFEAHFAFCREEPDRARFYYAICFGPLATSLAGDLKKFGRPLDEPVSAIGRRLAEVGVIQSGRDADFLFTCRGLIMSAVIDFLLKGGELGPALASRLVDILLRGFGEAGRLGREGQ
jgi:AcrR family transcriptional regulator